MNRLTLAAMLALALPTSAFAACYAHPDTGINYCSTASECPAYTVWNMATFQCAPVPPTFACPAGQVYSPPQHRCVQELPTCTYEINYQKNDPAATATLSHPIDYCPEIDYVLAVLLARLTAPAPH